MLRNALPTAARLAVFRAVLKNPSVGNMRLLEAMTKLTLDYSPDQPRDENGRWTNGGRSSTIKKPKMSKSEFNRVSSGILTDHPKLTAGSGVHTYYYGKNVYWFSVVNPGEYVFHSKERIKN